MEEQLFPERNKVFVPVDTVTDSTPLAKQQEENIVQMCLAINANKPFELQLMNNRRILNVFPGQRTTTEQASDTFNC